MENLKSIILAFVLAFCLHSLQAQEKKTISSQPIHFRMPKYQAPLPEVKEEIRYQVELKEQIIQEQLDEYLESLLKNKRISTNLFTTVNVNILNELSSSGKIEQNLHTKFIYEILGNLKDGIKSQIDDYPSGKYKLGASNAALSTMQILKQTVENNLAEFMTNGTNVTIKITGTTDASPVKSTIPYLNDFGPIEDFTYFLNNQISSISIDSKNGISSNEQLGLLRTFGVRQFMETYIEPLKRTTNSFEHFVETSDEIGGKNRRVTIELVVHDALKNYQAAPLSKTDSVNVKPVTKKSDVDINIPKTADINENVFAVIIGNEDYSSEQSGLDTEVNVDFAVNDALIFKEYCIKTLGLKEEHIILLKNATYNRMNFAINKVVNISEQLGDRMDILFYYSGHGLPDEKTKEAYLIPVDASGSAINPGTAIKVDDLYKRLTKHSPRKVTVFLDACFSGGGRNKGLLSLKGVKIKAVEAPLTGNLVEFASSSGEESSTVYKEKQHGLFTYYLLKKLQETKGNVSYKELSEYLSEKVKLESVVVNSRNQTPTTTGSPSVVDNWGSWKMK